MGFDSAKIMEAPQNVQVLLLKDAEGIGGEGVFILLGLGPSDIPTYTLCRRGQHY